MKELLIRSATITIALLSGLVALFAPFFILPAPQADSAFSDRTEQLPLMLTFLLIISLVILIFETQYHLTNPRIITLLGVLSAINATLRFVEIAIPGPGGFSPIFLLILSCGYIFGGTFGFLLGILTMLVSALITGGIGPWLPAQMYTAGWVGLSAPLLSPLVNKFKLSGLRSEVVLVAVLAGVWGLLYGVIMNLWFWPYMSGPSQMYLTGNIGTIEIVKRFAAFHLTTALGWDIFRAVGNVLLFLLFGRPILKTLKRYQKRFTYIYTTADQPVQNL